MSRSVLVISKCGLIIVFNVNDNARFVFNETEDGIRSDARPIAL